MTKIHNPHVALGKSRIESPTKTVAPNKTDEPAPPIEKKPATLLPTVADGFSRIGQPSLASRIGLDPGRPNQRPALSDSTVSGEPRPAPRPTGQKLEAPESRKLAGADALAPMAAGAAQLGFEISGQGPERSAIGGPWRPDVGGLVGGVAASETGPEEEEIPAGKRTLSENAASGTSATGSIGTGTGWRPDLGGLPGGIAGEEHLEEEELPAERRVLLQNLDPGSVTPPTTGAGRAGIPQSPSQVLPLGPGQTPGAGQPATGPGLGVEGGVLVNPGPGAIDGDGGSRPVFEGGSPGEFPPENP